MSDDPPAIGTRIDPLKIVLKMGFYEDPVEPLRRVLGTTADRDRALELDAGDASGTPAFITLNDGLWALVTLADGTVLEGPATRSHISAGLDRAESAVIVDYDETPFTGRKRRVPASAANIKGEEDGQR